MSEIADIIEAKIDEFDALREVFFAGDSDCYFLDKDGGEVEFSVTLLKTGGWYLDTKAKNLLIATNDLSLVENILLSSYFAVSGRVYQIMDDDGEGGDGRIPPEGEEPWIKLSFRRTGTRFEPEV